MWEGKLAMADGATQEVGYVKAVRNYLLQIDGLPTIEINDLVENKEGVKGVVNALHGDMTEVLLLDDVTVLPGELFKRTTNKLTLNVGEHLLGRAINPIGTPIDGRGQLTKTAVPHEEEVDKTALGIYSREFIKDQFVSGITIVDTLVPLGKGQRELVIGDAHSGKSTFLIDLILNSKQAERICIYAMIGKPATAVRNLIDILRENNALSYSIIVGTSSADPAPLIFMTPHTAMTIAEYFQKKGKDVLIILDDLGVHAKVYREISLLGDSSPGRESYPGDIFYQHSHLLERAGNYNIKYGGGSITAIPVMELNLNDFSGYISTNLMSMTDGHLLFSASLHNQGIRPAIDISLSVSRVGRQTQDRVQNALSQKIREVLVRASQFETLSRFSSELPQETQIILNQKKQVDLLLQQDTVPYISLEVQTLMLCLVFTAFFQSSPLNLIESHKNHFIEAFNKDPKLNFFVQNYKQYKTVDDLIKALDGAKDALDAVAKSKPVGLPIESQTKGEQKSA